MRFTLTLIGLLTSFMLSYVKIWVVDNKPVSVGDFTDLASAQNTPGAGDSIFVYPSPVKYTGITVTKKLFFFGVGINLDIYGGQAYPASSSINGAKFFNPGSQGSLLDGFDGAFFVDVNIDNITVKRNSLYWIKIDGSNCVILQNEMVEDVSPAVLRVEGNNANILIANNKIYNPRNFWGDRDAVEGAVSSTMSVINNILRADIGDAAHELSNTSIVLNNIIVNGACSTNPAYQHNMSQSNQLPTGPGNMINIDINMVFEDPSDFTTGLQLLPTSPANGAGFNGTDMGIYGGNTPFVNGGYPNLPAIYYLETEATTIPHRGLNILIKSKSKKEWGEI